MTLMTLSCIAAFTPLVGAILAGFLGWKLGRAFSHTVAIASVAISFLQLFFGWEAVGLVSYLLIGFWFTRPTAIYANLKAFLVNRVGDFGFLLGVGIVFAQFGTLDYGPVFIAAPDYMSKLVEIIPGQGWSLMSVICICLFVVAMGKR